VFIRVLQAFANVFFLYSCATVGKISADSKSRGPSAIAKLFVKKQNPERFYNNVHKLKTIVVITE